MAGIDAQPLGALVERLVTLSTVTVSLLSKLVR
jgi:hypothetical protein